MGVSAAVAINGAKAGTTALTQEDIVQLRKLYTDMLFAVLGLQEEKGTNATEGLDAGLMDVLLTLRADAKHRKDFATSDLIRDKLAALGIAVKDTKEGVVWERG